MHFKKNKISEAGIVDSPKVELLVLADGEKLEGTLRGFSNFSRKFFSYASKPSIVVKSFNAILFLVSITTFSKWDRAFVTLITISLGAELVSR